VHLALLVPLLELPDGSTSARRMPCPQRFAA
jgi:hypothetical protein